VNPSRRTAFVALVAVLGIVLAAAITYGTSQLVRQHIGLASEPITAGRTLLAPVAAVHSRVTTRATPAPRSSVSKAPVPARTAPGEAAPAPASSSPASTPEGGPGGSGSGPAVNESPTSSGGGSSSSSSSSSPASSSEKREAAPEARSEGGTQGSDTRRRADD
jgi:uncharacterized membrane protein YgcG